MNGVTRMSDNGSRLFKKKLGTFLFVSQSVCFHLCLHFFQAETMFQTETIFKLLKTDGHLFRKTSR